MLDPYEKWLGIPKDERPVTYYRLLGVSPKETDAAVIAKAAQRRGPAENASRRIPGPDP